MRVLEIGPGTADGKSLVFPKAVTLDPEGTQTSVKARWGLDPIPLESNSFDLVFASHVLEHIPWYRTDFALSEAYRVLKPGGEFEVYVPDFAFIVDCYLKKRCGDNWRIFNEEGDWMTWVNGRLFTYGEDAVELKSKERPLTQTHHKTVFDPEYMKAKLLKAGFRVQLLEQRRNGPAHKVQEVAAIGTK